MWSRGIKNPLHLEGELLVHLPEDACTFFDLRYSELCQENVAYPRVGANELDNVTPDLRH